MKRRQVILSIITVLIGILLVACGSSEPELGLYEIGNEQFAKIVASDNEAGYWVYIGRPTCQYCRELEPILEETLQYLEAPMYYYQTAKARYDDEDKMLSLLAPLDIEGIPIIVHLINGEVVAYLIGVHTQDEIIVFINEHGGIN